MKTVFDTAPEDAAKFLDEALADETWSADELASILKHQLSASLQSDLFKAMPDETIAGDSIAEHQAFLEGSYRDLLSHIAPPLALLRLVKDYAKTCRSRRRGLIPDDVATVLYYAAIVAARVRLSENITSISDQSLRRGLKWALAQPWLDSHLRALFSAAMGGLGGE